MSSTSPAAGDTSIGISHQHKRRRDDLWDFGCNAPVTRRQRRLSSVAGMAGQTTFECDARGASVEALRAEALEHEARFSHWQDSSGAAGMELFRRAIVEHDEAAWRAVVEIYGGMLAAQAGRRALRGLIAEDDGFCVDRAFQRFWIATRRNRLEAERFGDLSAVLKYLKMCLASVLLDEARARLRAGCG